MRLRRLGNGALACAGIVLAFAGCSSSGTDPASTQTSRWPGPGFAGGGVAGLSQSIAAGVPALSCGDPSQFTFTKGPAPGALAHLSCFYDASNSQPAAAVEWIVESADEGDLVHVRLTLNPDFADNTYGANCIGWPAKHGPGGKHPQNGKVPAPMDAKAPHTFMDLVGSDHAEFKLSDADGNLALHFKEDYLSPDMSAASGYASLGVLGGDGKMIEGNPDDVVAVSTSLERNLNACGLASYTVDSPPTDENYTPAAGAEAWDYRVVYDVWVQAAAFGSAGFGDAVVDFVHASPSKADSPTSKVTKRPCPPEWRKYCTKPEGCSAKCGDQPDESCADASVPPPPTKQCGDEPDDVCTDASVPPPPNQPDAAVPFSDDPI